jgi:hypothetical protein
MRFGQRAPLIGTPEVERIRCKPTSFLDNARDGPAACDALTKAMRITVPHGEDETRHQPHQTHEIVTPLKNG